MLRPSTSASATNPLHVCFLWKRFSYANGIINNYDVVITVNGGENVSDNLTVACDLIETDKLKPSAKDQQKVADEFIDLFKGIASSNTSFNQSTNNNNTLKFLRDHCSVFCAEQTRMRFSIDSDHRIKCLKILFTNPNFRVYHEVNFDQLQKQYCNACYKLCVPGGNNGLRHDLRQATLLLSQSSYISFKNFRELLLDNIIKYETRFAARQPELNAQIIKLLKDKCTAVTNLSHATDGLRIKELVSYIKACSNEIIRDQSSGLFGDLVSRWIKPDLVITLESILAQLPVSQLDISTVNPSDELAKQLQQKSQNKQAVDMPRDQRYYY